MVTDADIGRRSAAITGLSGGCGPATDPSRFARGRSRWYSEMFGHPSVATMHLCVAALACLTVGGGCSGGSLDTSAFQPAPTVALAWDQSDGLAEYYLVKTGALLVRTEQPSVRLQLTAAAHVVEITSCNTAGCSEPSSVVLDWRDGHWVLMTAEQEDTLPPGSHGDPQTSGLRRQRSIGVHAAEVH